MRTAIFSLAWLATVSTLPTLSACSGPAETGDAAPHVDSAATDAPPGSPCAILDEPACLAREDCSAGYDIYDCENILGYCAVFSSCGDGPVDCVGPAACDILEPPCAGPYVISYTSSCYGPCVRADQCAGCRDDKMMFTQADGCANDGAVEFCIPPLLSPAIQLLAPTTICATGSGRVGCNLQTQLLCQFPLDDTTCVTPLGAMTDETWATLCTLTLLPDVTQIVPSYGI